MMNFISLNLRYGGNININVDKIDTYKELKEMNFSVVVVNGRNIEVKETEYDITNLIYDIDTISYLKELNN